MRRIGEYITEYVSSGRGMNTDLSISDIEDGDMVAIRSKEELLKMTTRYGCTGRYYFKINGSYSYMDVSDEMIDMGGEVCEVIDVSSTCVKLFSKKYPKMMFWWHPDLLKRI